jgi:site-specific recombinase
VRQIRPGLIGATSNPNTNLLHLIEEIKVANALRIEMVPRLQEFLISRDYVTAITETGLTLDSGVFSELFQRIEYNLLPKPVENANILSFFNRLFDSRTDADWLERIDKDRFSELLQLLIPDYRPILDALAPQLFMSLEILSLKLAGLGYDPIVADRIRSRRDFQTAFMDVPRHVHALLDGKGDAAIPGLRASMAKCKEAIAWVREKRATQGISLSLTYRLIKIQQVLHRMELVLELIESVLGEWNPKSAKDLFFEIVLTEIQRFNVRRFITENIELLAFQITEHTGRAGEHYITRSRSEWRQMFTSASYGGAIVGLLAVLKFVGAHLHLPPAPEALLNSLIYSIGFLTIHAVGGTLATKQPAMTASKLAASLDGAMTSLQAMKNLAEIIVRTIRSQMIALLGNYLIALPVAAFICLPFISAGHPIMGREKAWAVLESLQPFTSLSFFYAAVAGVGLFLSGVLAGLVDNWFVFNNVGSRLKHSELLHRFVTPVNLDKTIEMIDHNIGFWVGNIALGFYLGCMGPIGHIFGLPLDVRHITFSSAQMGVALAHLNFQVPVGMAITILCAIFTMGLINLTVSFSLSLLLAIRSRHIKFSQTRELLSLLGDHLRMHPMEFFFPVRDPETVEH